MATLIGEDGSFDVPNELLRATIWRAERAAGLVGDFFQRMGLRSVAPNGELEPLVLPASALLELAAALEIAVWRVTGVLDLVGEDVPNSETIAELLKQSLEMGETIDPERLPLTRLAMRIQTWQLAWSGPVFFGAELVINSIEADEDRYIIALAEYLWAQRRSMPRRFNDETT